LDRLRGEESKLIRLLSGFKLLSSLLWGSFRLKSATLRNNMDANNGLFAAGAQKPKLSIFLPVFNEEENLPRLNEKIFQAMGRLGHSFEVIYVDDGSADRSLELLTK